MLVARYRNILVGVVLGSVALFLTFHVRSIIALDTNPVMRALNAAAFAMVVPVGPQIQRVTYEAARSPGVSVAASSSRLNASGASHLPFVA